MRSLNLSAGARNCCCCCCGVKKLTIFDPSHFNVKRGCGEIPRDLSQKSVTLTWQQRDNSLSQLPLNITGALSASHEEDHFADSPWYYCDQGWGPWHWHQTMWETEKLLKIAISPFHTCNVCFLKNFFWNFKCFIIHSPVIQPHKKAIKSFYFK